MNTRKEIPMEYKVEINSLNNFKAWSGGLSTLNTVRERGGIDTLTTICEDLFSGNTPTEHSALSFSPGQAGADPTYSHIAFVEQVKSDCSILISESNVKGLGVVSYRTFDAETAKQFTYVIGK